jgi:hypothetical protein
MSSVFKKSLKGIDEVAFKTNGLPLRLVSYLLAVDGLADTDELARRFPHLPSIAAVLQGLMEQGYVEVANAGVQPMQARNVVEMSPMRVGNGAPAASPARAPVQPANYLPPSMQAAPAPQPPPARPAAPFTGELDIIKSNMVRDVSTLLGSDADMVIAKIQNCRTKDDLFAAMMGIKKIITMYRDKNVAEKFATRYEQLSR